MVGLDAQRHGPDSSSQLNGDMIPETLPISGPENQIYGGAGTSDAALFRKNCSKQQTPERSEAKLLELFNKVPQ